MCPRLRFRFFYLLRTPPCKELDNSRGAPNGPSKEQTAEMNVIKGIFVFIYLLYKLFYFYVIELLHFLLPQRRKDVAGEIILVTGAGHGIGREIAVQFGRLGARVVIWDMNKVKMKYIKYWPFCDTITAGLTFGGGQMWRRKEVIIKRRLFLTLKRGKTLCFVPPPRWPLRMYSVSPTVIPKRSIAWFLRKWMLSLLDAIMNVYMEKPASVMGVKFNKLVCMHVACHSRLNNPVSAAYHNGYVLNRNWIQLPCLSMDS